MARFRGLDVAVVTTLLVTLGAMIPPAIHNSRHEVRVASCQEDLRNFGQALADRGQRQGQGLAQLANRGQLTRTGMFAAELLQDAYLTTTHRTVCPDAWLAVQGLLRGAARGASLRPKSLEMQPAGPPIAMGGDWSDMWSDGVTGDWSPSSVDASPLLADAPRADVPGQGLPGHGGRGRNVLFEDGHAEFLHAVGSVGAADWFVSGAEEATTNGGLSAPIVLVNGR
jgi:prepilin-type processing-associated H-X9-DG protein